MLSVYCCVVFVVMCEDMRCSVRIVVFDVVVTCRDTRCLSYIVVFLLSRVGI